jgi:type I restriction-modification system DNA methylase subunit
MDFPVSTSIETFKSSLQNLIAKFDSDKLHYLSNPYLEAQARIDFITPFFEALGWDVANKEGLRYDAREVIVEKGESDTPGRPDYSFRVEGQTKFFVEAKAPSEPLSVAKDIVQAKGYAWNTRRVFFVVLTDFVEFRFYDATIQPDERKPDEGLLLRLAYRDYLHNAEKLWEFSKQRVIAGSLDAMMPRDRRTQRLRIPVDEAFLDEMTGWREDLARDVFRNNPALTAKQLNEVVQRLLDRIVFIRIAEDRHIIEKNQLRDAVEEWRARGGKFHILDWLNDLFHRINEDFNGEIFKPHLSETIKIDSGVLARIIERLYPPKSPYRFDVIGVELLGSIYERYLGNTIRLTAKQVRLEEKPDVRKAGGVYYTPKYIVDYIVKGTVGNVIEGRTLKQVEKVRILDPACGSGSFLIGAFQFLIDYHLRWYLEHPKEERRGRPVLDFMRDVQTDPDGLQRLSVFRKVAILKNNLFGVDIDPQAVEITMMSLYLKALEGEKQLLPSKQSLLPPLRGNIICGNSLIGPEFYHNRQKSLIDEYEESRVNAFDWHAGFGEILDGGGFDIVIGNPPYRRELNYKHLMDDIASTPFGLKYRSPRMDLWYYFVHRGLELLRPSGVLSFIVNAYWTAGTGAGKLITALRDTTHVDEIFSFGKLAVFQGVSGQHMVIRLTKAQSKAATTIKLAGRTSGKSAEPFVLDKAPVATFNKLATQLFRGGKIDLQPDSGGSLAQVDRGIPLRELGKIRQGIAENPASINRKTNKKYRNRFEVGEGVFTLRPEELEQLALPAKERALLRAYHDLKDIGRYRLSRPSLSLIYSTPKTCPDISDYPKIRAHLSRFRPIMEARRETRKGSNSWWHLHWPRDEEIWKSRKILSLQMASRPAFVPAEQPVYVPFSVNVFVPLESTKEHLNYISAILNSRLLWEWYRHHAKSRGVGLEINGHVLGATPIHEIDFSDRTEKSRHDRIVDLVDRIITLNSRRHSGRLAPSDIDRTEREIAAADSEIDEIVYKLYGLTKGGHAHDSQQLRSLE